MAIQFQCPACKQPIEIEGDWAGKPVACPYCRKTVTAPESSTFVPSGPPVATPLGEQAEPAWGARPEYPRPQASGNALAGWAIMLACAAPVLFVAYSMLVFARIQALVGPNPTPEEARQAVMDLAESGDLPGWLIGAFLLLIAAFGSWTAGLICGIIAVRRPARRRLAVASLVVCGGLLVLMCVVFAVGVAGGAAG